jgi:hypothetical protein
MQLFNRFCELLGSKAEESRLISLLDDLGIMRRPLKPTMFKSPYEVSFRLSKHGISLSFQEENYFRNASPRSWGQGDLILSSVIASSGLSGQMMTYADPLPFDLLWSDTRSQVREKINAHEKLKNAMHAGWRDSWWSPERFFTVTYQPGTVDSDEQPGIYEIVQGLFLPTTNPALLKTKEICPTPEQLIACFGQSLKSEYFKKIFKDFDFDDIDADTHIDLSRTFGLEIYLDSGRQASDGEFALVGFNLKRDRLGPSQGWQGILPFDLQWDHSIHDVAQKIGRTSDQWDTRFDSWGWAKWFFSDHVFWINFDTVRNRIESIALMDLEYEKDRKLF